MEAAAKELVKLPGIGIDINMGCSAPDIYRFGSGIGWMLKPIEETKEMVQAVSAVIKNHNEQTGENKRFSIKLRLGDDNFTDNQFFDFCDMLVSNGAKMLTLHPRTKKEKLSRPARYFYCEELAKRYKKDGVEIVLNGNVKDKASFDNAISKAPSVDGVMISRAAVQKPWIFYQLAKGGVGNCELIEENEKTVDLQQLCLDYIKDIEKYQPKEFWKTRLQRFFTYFSENFKFAHYAKTSFLNAKDNEDLRQKVNAFFTECPEEKKYKISFSSDF